MDATALLTLILKPLEFVYSADWVAPFIVLPAMLMVAGFLHFEAVQRTKPFLAAAKSRVRSLASALGDDPDPVAERSAFSANFIEVSAALNEEQPGALPLVQAWREFHESLIDETATPIRNSVRPNSFFGRAAPRQNKLVFSSNVFVGVGLILTFLGLIVALRTAATGMDGDTNTAKEALRQLLVVAGAKFFTSIAGLLASLWLRFVEHQLTRQVNAELDTICGLLERGLLYIPPQRLAAEQLEVLKEQRDELKTFNTDLAFQIGERFQQAIAPVAVSLTQLNNNFESMSQGIGQGAAKAIEEASGGELRALGQTLATLGERLDTLGASVGASGDDAARQIRAAGEDFAKAAADIRDAFGQLVGQVDGIGDKLVEQGEAAAKAQEEAQTRSVETMAEAVRALQEAGASAAATMQREVTAALAAGVAESQQTLRLAVEESGEGLRAASGELARAVAEAANQVDRAAGGFERSGESASQTADAMANVTGNARTLATTLGDAAKGLAVAADPVAKAAAAVNEAAGRIARSVEAQQSAGGEALAGLNSLADGIRETQSAAEEAWLEYRARFEGVDKSLEQAALKLGQTLGDSLDEFRKFAQQTDRELASAMGKLSNVLSSIDDYAEALDGYVEDGRKARAEAAE